MKPSSLKSLLFVLIAPKPIQCSRLSVQFGRQFYWLLAVIWLGLGLSTQSFAACHKSLIPDAHQSLAQGATERVYRIHFPPGYALRSDNPVVLMLHGWGSDENTFLDDAVIREAADARGFVLVAPRGLGSGAPDFGYNSWTFSGSASGVTKDGLPICDTKVTPNYRYPSCQQSGIAQNTCSWTHCQNLPHTDTAFLLTLTAKVEDTLCIDSKKIFVFGGSNGGNAMWELPDNPVLSEKIAAMASLIGLPHKSYIDSNSAFSTPAALLITGTRDLTDPPGPWDDLKPTTTSNQSDRFFYESASATISAWSQRQGCKTGFAARRLESPTPFDCRSYCPGDLTTSPALDCRIDMGHDYQLVDTWPFILEFFLNHGLDQSR
ncbi:MAG: hypothetical protein QF849_18355 [Pseudomonadales bacterium]|jgi:poly(3-hydroxybutyrate) depolymerase|nr:hypothetical protein [Pseudomonadales bacterium]|tara:strand:+ start:1134 stop:2264 length:1131 start_codon:yes stop_codon:yes gene_type:complete